MATAILSKPRESESISENQTSKSTSELKHALGSSAYAVPVPSELTSLSRPLKPAQPCFAIDVECVATGPGHNARAVAHVALVNQWCQVVLNVYIKPKEKVFSYLTDLTGLTEQSVSKGVSLEQATKMIKSVLPQTAILIGQNILKDIGWLNLKEEIDFAGMMDLAGLWRVFNTKYKNYSYFSLHHKAKALLGYKHVGAHDPATDAILSIQLYNLYKQLEHYPAQVAFAHQLLLNTSVDESFAKKYSVYDGVCMGQKKSCKCGSPFFF
jgi:RNA exonuclease 4